MWALMGAARGVAASVDENVLWKIVHGLCVVDEKRLHSPAPCVAVDLKGGEEGGSAILKDLVGKTQFLLIPTRRVTGMEDPLVGTDALPNYWRAAWAAWGLVSKNTGKNLPRDDIGMAINGVGARTQDQLHIHVDCVRADVRAALDARAAEIGDKWTDFRLPGHTYRARRIAGEEPDPDPFRLLAEDGPSSPLAEDSLAVIGVRQSGGEPGFVLLAEKAAQGKTHAENLLDHSCAVAGR
jgi:CDP-diacylglycerol pyrophosphatase